MGTGVQTGNVPEWNFLHGKTPNLVYTDAITAKETI